MCVCVCVCVSASMWVRVCCGGSGRTNGDELIYSSAFEGVTSAPEGMVSVDTHTHTLHTHRFYGNAYLFYVMFTFMEIVHLND